MILATIPAQVKIDWYLLWSKTGWLDILFLFAFFVGVVIGMRGGLVKVLPRLVQVISAQTVAMEYGAALADFLNSKVHLPIFVLHAVVFAALAVATILLTAFGFRVLSFFASIEFKAPFNHALGSVLSGLQLVLWLSLISQFLVFFPLPFIQKTYDERSISGPYLIGLNDEVHHSFVRLIPESWRVH